MDGIKDFIHLCEYRLMHFVIFILKNVNSALKIFFGYSTHSGFLKDKDISERDYEKCVHVQSILWRAQQSQLSKKPIGCFFLKHESYESPKILRKVVEFP